VVDRHALGEQVADEFKTTRMVGAHTFADIFGLKELADVTPETATKVHICTIQGLVKRVLFADLPQDAPSVDSSTSSRPTKACVRWKVCCPGDKLKRSSVASLI
jgi:hypothetical protein